MADTLEFIEGLDIRSGEQGTLADGRRFGMIECGDPSGVPMLTFHGSPGTRLLNCLVHDRAQASGVRVISLDRPGCGLSDMRRLGSFRDYAADVAEIADQLGLDRFAAAGASGGGAYALACAHELADRVTVCCVICGMLPLTETESRGWKNPAKFAFTLARRAPWLPRPLFRHTAKRWDRVADRFAKSLPPADAARASQPVVRKAMSLDYESHLTFGFEGGIQDLALYTRPLDFRLEDISVPVHVFHGDEDVNVPVAVARRAAAAVPGAVLHEYAGEGHMFFVERFADICEVVTSQ